MIMIPESAVCLKFEYRIPGPCKELQGPCGGHPLVKQVVTLSFNAKVDLADFWV